LLAQAAHHDLVAGRAERGVRLLPAHAGEAGQVVETRSADDSQKRHGARVSHGLRPRSIPWYVPARLEQLVLLCAMLFGAAFLYSAVGHAGASGYLAAMAIMGLDPAVMKPTALVLNILVASMTFFRFWRAGYFRWRTVWPFL